MATMNRQVRLAARPDGIPQARDSRSPRRRCRSRATGSSWCATSTSRSIPPAGSAFGQLCYREDILAGLDHAPDAIAGLYRGENLGKRLIKL